MTLKAVLTRFPSPCPMAHLRRLGSYMGGTTLSSGNASSDALTASPHVHSFEARACCPGGERGKWHGMLRGRGGGHPVSNQRLAISWRPLPGPAPCPYRAPAARIAPAHPTPPPPRARLGPTPRCRWCSSSATGAASGTPWTRGPFTQARRAALAHSQLCMLGVAAVFDAAPRPPSPTSLAHAAPFHCSASIEAFCCAACRCQPTALFLFLFVVGVVECVWGGV